MGREIRMVPPNWEHPKKQKFGYFASQMKGEYMPLYNRDLEAAWLEWQARFLEWCESGGDVARAKYGAEKYPKDEPYRSFCTWDGMPPNPRYYRPKWPEGSATWFQVYETVSEGTPVTPPFATRDELVEYLVENGDFWDQSRRDEGVPISQCGPWSREAAESFVGRGWSPSMVTKTGPTGTEVILPRDGL